MSRLHALKIDTWNDVTPDGGSGADELGLSQPTVSHHLKKLTDAGLLHREQRGKWAYFTLRRDAVEKLAAVADLKGACC